MKAKQKRLASILDMLIDNDDDEKNIVNKTDYITDEGLVLITNYLPDNLIVDFVKFVANNYTSVLDMFKVNSGIDINVQASITNNYTTLNGYFWNYDLNNRDYFKSTYQDMLLAVTCFEKS